MAAKKIGKRKLVVTCNAMWSGVRCSNPATKDHGCPYKEEINNDHTTMCNCCVDCQRNCCMEI